MNSPKNRVAIPKVTLVLNIKIEAEFKLVSMTIYDDFTFKTSIYKLITSHKR